MQKVRNLLAVTTAAVLASSMARTDYETDLHTYVEERAKTMDTDGASSYLMQFGYYPPGMDRKIMNVLPKIVQKHVTKQAMERFQKYMGLDETGILDKATREMLSTPRCGMTDRSGFDLPENAGRRRKRFVLQGSRWGQTDLTYRIVSRTSRLSRREVDNTIQRALQFWSDESGLKFRRVDSSANIDVQFVTGRHLDESGGNAFDGPGGVLAHAFYPTHPTGRGIAGDAHFDNTESWTLGKSRGINLLATAVHEFGHSMGLEHNPSRESIMFPSIQTFKPNLRLGRDDVRGIQSLYGAPVVATRPPRTTPRPPRTTRRPARTTRRPARTTRRPARTTRRPARTTRRPARTTRRPARTTRRPSRTTPRRSRTTSRPRPTRRPSPDDRNPCSGTLDAILVNQADENLAFRGSLVFKLDDDGGVVTGYPKPISEEFTGLPQDGMFVDAALSFNSFLVLFRGDRYWQINRSNRAITPAGRPISDIGIPSDMRIRAAFSFNVGNKIYLFTDTEYYRYTFGRGLDDGYPKAISNWNGIPNSPDGAVQWKNNRIYFFKGSQYWRYDLADDNVDSGYPKSTAKYWFGCSS